MMNISKFFSKLIFGLAIIGFTSIGLATQWEGKQSEGNKAIKSEAIIRGRGSAAKAESDVKEGLSACFPFYNNERFHQALGYRTLKEVHYN